MTPKESLKGSIVGLAVAEAIGMPFANVRDENLLRSLIKNGGCDAYPYLYIGERTKTAEISSVALASSNGNKDKCIGLIRESLSGSCLEKNLLIPLAVPFGLFLSTEAPCIEWVRGVCEAASGEVEVIIQCSACAAALLARMCVAGTPSGIWGAMLERPLGGVCAPPRAKPLMPVEVDETVGGDRFMDKVSASVSAAARGGPVPPFRDGSPDSVLAESLYHVLSNPRCYEAAVSAAAMSGGSDSLTVAALTGALSGGLLGEDGIPARWIDKIEGLGEVQGTADKLAAARG